MNKICLLLIALSLSGLVWAQEAPRYEVYAVRYGTIPDFPVAELVRGADKQRKLDIAMIVWLVRGGGRTILVDSGFYRPQYFKEWTVRDYVRPDEAVAKLGVKPEDVTDVVITHMHWDHADGADLFPRAKIGVQKDEYTYYTGEAWQDKRTHGGIGRCADDGEEESSGASWAGAGRCAGDPTGCDVLHRR